MTEYGTLYGIGVGPGDPDLITLAAVKALGRADVVLAASSSKNDYSTALGIVAAHMPARAEIIKLDFPMTTDQGVLRAAWLENLEKTVAVLRQGKNAAFITLGDPMIYSTFGYLLTLLREGHPQIRVEVVPGVTSFQAAAARTRTILCENSQNLLIIPGIRDGKALNADLALADNAAILKAYRNLPVIKKCLAGEAEQGAENDTGRTVRREARDHVFVSRLGLDNELIRKGLDDIPENPNYLSLILTTRKRG